MQGPATIRQALALFDTLQPVDLAFMSGRWRGGGFPSLHPLDGVLEACHWHGKHFESADRVYPLLFRTRNDGIVAVNPFFIKPVLGIVARVGLPSSDAFGKLFQSLLPLLRTTRPTARLRITNYRGKQGASMVYNQLPVQDVFRSIDDDTVLGLMEMRGMQRPFFFTLRRERSLRDAEAASTLPPAGPWP